MMDEVDFVIHAVEFLAIIDLLLLAGVVLHMRWSPHENNRYKTPKL
jgi:hypothetical protein